MDANAERKAVATLYGASFVKKMADDQIHAIYMKLKKNGKL